jgi:mono/diheme cytochrome c family protein
MRPQDLRIPLTRLIVALALLVLAACGGGGSSSQTRGETTEAVPTMPPARFTAVAEQSVLTRTATLTATATLTEPLAETRTETTTEEGAAVPVAAADLERGARSYERNKCADCHGAQGEGIAGKGQAIAGTALSEEAFTNLLRTGGGLGNMHIFGPSAVSPAGMGALYTYVQSLK